MKNDEIDVLCCGSPSTLTLGGRRAPNPPESSEMKLNDDEE
jgi:hypothetical protein